MCCCAFLSLLPIIAGKAMAGGGPKNVLVVQNRQSALSQRIARYYVQARDIPPENVCTINCSTSEVVDYTECEENIKTPIRVFLANPTISSRIDYIVLTKGIPLAARYIDPSNGNYFSSGALSVTSVLTCLDDPTVNTLIVNPYGPEAFTEATGAFSHSNKYGGMNLYLVTRLDGYTEGEIYRMIDGAVSPSQMGCIALDRAVPVPNKTMNDRLKAAYTLLAAKGVPVIYDNTSTFLGNLTNLMGYFSWGSNDPCYNAANYHSNYFVPGSIADTYVSTSARAFKPITGGQSLVADLIFQGASGVGGYVSEPYTQTTWPQVLFDKYTSGYNLAESFYAASPRLFWKHTVVGDPLMAPYAKYPYIAINSPGQLLTGLTTISVTATATSGIAKVDFYFDDVYQGSATQEPWQITVDTTLYTVGSHTVEAIATDASSIAAQASAFTVMTVSNPVSNLRVVADAFNSPDGQGVCAAKKVVTAVFAGTGGWKYEFYIQEENGYNGIRVLSNTFVGKDDLVTVVGDLSGESSERTICASLVAYMDSLMTPLKPVFMLNRAVGGGNISSITKGVTGGVGLRNIGVLIKTCGKVTYIGGGGEKFFYIDDGSALSDGSGHKGLRVDCGAVCESAAAEIGLVTGENVIVTGISSCETIEGRIIPKVKIRDLSDVH
ncbi:MAG: TIGR03790 family protein [Armatimonadota bacterium]|nr:TIGR03790 family protein [bacterium]